MVRTTGNILVERLATIIFCSVVLTALVTAAFMVSPYMGFAMVGTIIFFSVIR